jgi:hypothetical protein
VDGFYFVSATRPFDYDAVTSRAYKAWEDAGLEKSCFTSAGTHLPALPGQHPCDLGDAGGSVHGHSNKSMRGRYTDGFDGHLAEDGAGLDEFLSGAEAEKIVKLNERAA